MQLTNASIGKKVRITDIACVNELVRRRLIDLGFMEGTVVSLKKALPFCGPCTIESNGQCIAIRHKEAVQIMVEAIC